MRTFLGVLLVVCGYVVIYYRLMVRHHYEQHHRVKETAFGALFSFPPYGQLPEAGKKYARRYWIAVAVMTGCLLAIAAVTDFAAWRLFQGAAG
jgi:hypothetical protein